MKTLKLAVILAFLSAYAHAEGIEFFHGTWSEALAKAKTENKGIFVDVYAVWCGPCKYMTREIFTVAEVGDYFNQHFISFKVDGENEEPELIKSIDLEAFPTLLFYDPAGTLVTKNIGALDDAGLLTLAKRAASFPASQKKVQSGSASREELVDYLMLIKDSKPDEFKRLASPLVTKMTGQDLANPANWELFTGAVTDLLSPDFKKVIENASMLSETHEGFSDYVNGVLQREFEAAASKGDLAGLKPYKQILGDIYNSLGDKKDPAYLDQKINADYYLYREEYPQYAAALIKWVDTFGKDDWNLMANSAVKLSENVPGDSNFQTALRWANEAVKLDRNKNSLFLLGVVYENCKQNAKALSTFQTLLQMDLDEDELEVVNSRIEALKEN
ncbi:MAG: thioredoxin family protein [Cyclobacteriaceae bacterium]|jgi:thioredoxin-related protein